MNKIVLITGTSSGFGKAASRHLVSKQYRVYGTSRRATFPAAGEAATYPVMIPMDVRDDTSVQAAVDFILEREGRILTRDWELYDGQHVVFTPANMSVDQLQQGNMRTWRKVYSYASIAKRMRATPISRGLFLAANFGYRFYGRRLDRFYTCDWQLLQPESTRPGRQAA